MEHNYQIKTDFIFSSASYLAEVIKSPWRPSSVVRRRRPSSSSGVKVHLFLNRWSNYLEIWWQHALCDSNKRVFFVFNFVEISIFYATFSKNLTLENRGFFFFKMLLLPQFFIDQFHFFSATTLGGPNFEFWLCWFFFF